MEVLDRQALNKPAQDVSSSFFTGLDILIILESLSLGNREQQLHFSSAVTKAKNQCMGPALFEVAQNVDKSLPVS